MSKAKGKINTQFGFDQWGKKEYRENIYSGCYNCCFYCGVRKNQCIRLKNRLFNQWELMKFYKNEFYKEIEKRNDISIFPTAHDIFPFNKRICFKFLKRLINPKPNIFNKVLVVSKPRLKVMKALLDYLRKLDLLQYVEIRYTITTKNNNEIKFWEKNATLYEERKEILEITYSYGGLEENSIVAEPYLCTPDELISLIDDIKDYISGDIWIGHMNRISSKEKLIEGGYTKIYIEEHQKIRENKSKEGLINIVKGLENNKKIKYKESFLRKKFLEPLIPDFQVPKLVS